MALFNTHKLLKNLRVSGYDTERTVDSNGNRVYHVRYQREMLNRQTDQNEADLETVAKVIPSGLIINLGFFDLCFGRPFLYSVNGERYDAPEYQRARQITNDLFPGSTRDEDRRYVAVAGDSLFDIAERFYGNGARWHSLAELNRLDERTGMINPGDILRIPRNL